MSSSDLVWAFVRCRVKATTDKAFCTGTQWIPYGQCEEYSVAIGDNKPSDTNERPTEGVFVDAVCIPLWLAARNNMEIDE